MMAKSNALNWASRRALNAICAAPLLLGAGGSSAAPSAHVDEPTQTQELNLRFAPVVGAEAVYDIRQAGAFRIDHRKLAEMIGGHPTGSSAQEASPYAWEEYQSRAQLHLRVLERSESGYLVAAQLHDVEMSIGGVTDPRAGEAQTPFALYIRADGQIYTVELPRHFPASIASMVRGILDPLQVTLPRDGTNAWRATESTLAGENRVSYEREDGQHEAAGIVKIQRQLLNAHRVPPLHAGRLGNKTNKLHTKVLSSKGMFAWDMRRNMLWSIRTEEETETTQNGAPFASEIHRFEAHRVEGIPADAPATKAALQRMLQDDQAARRAFYEADSHFVHRLRGLKTVDVIAQAREHLAKRDQASASYLVGQFLRHMPHESKALVEQLLAQDLTEDAAVHFAMVGMSGVGHAGHVQAQQAIADAMQSASLDYIARRCAAVATMSVTRPEPFLVDALWGMRESLPRTSSARNWERLSEITNLYGIASSVEKSNPKNTQQALARMGERLQSTNDPVEKLMMLVAIGNLGDLDRGLELAAPYFGDPNEDLASRAFAVFQRARSAQAVQEWETRFRSLGETKVNVRQFAAQVLLDMPRSEARAQVVRQLVRNEQDPRIVSYFIRILGEELQDGSQLVNEEALRELLSHVRDRKLRKEIYRYIHPQRRGAK